MSLSQPDFTLEYVFEHLAGLPTFPKVAQKALSMLEDPNVAISELATLLKYDPSITANILKITNSARYGLQQQVTTLDTALALLGQKQIREIIITSASLPYLSKPIRGYGMESFDLWAHSLGCALTSEVLSRYTGFSSPDVLFTAALLHDLGKMVLNIYIGPRLEEIQDIARHENIAFSEAEWRVIGGEHAVIGAQLLRFWEFPPDIVKAVRTHHDPDLYIQNDLASLLALSNIITVNLGIGVGVDEFRHNINVELLKHLDLDRKDFLKCMGRALEAFRGASDLVNLAK